MELSAKVEYALLSLVEMASQPNQTEPMQIKEIASRQGIPDRYLEQVFHHCGELALCKVNAAAKADIP